MENKAIHQRVAIIGAGAAGLTAADTLHRKGYQQVTVFEKTDRVGGKCCTEEVAGRLYEMGAGIIAQNNNTVLGLVKKYIRAVFE